MENERRNGCYRIRLKKTVAGKEKREDFDMIAFLNWLDGVLWGVPLIALMILTPVRADLAEAGRLCAG